MMGGAAVFDRIVALQTARLFAIATGDGRIQIQRMPQQNRPHAASDSRIKASENFVVRR
jgi:hypothetical protein